MRKALAVGIDYYEHFNDLKGCALDAQRVHRLLERNSDRSVNFVQPKLVAAPDENHSITRGHLKDLIEELFNDKNEMALFYFSGHGYIKDKIGYLCTSDCKRGDDGLSMEEIILLAHASEPAPGICTAR